MREAELRFLRAYRAWINDPNPDNEDDLVLAGNEVAGNRREFVGKSVRFMHESLARERHAELSRVLEDARDGYYGKSDPPMADEEYDELMRELRAIEADYPALATPDSPSQTVGVSTPAANKVEHVVPMLSLLDVTTEAEVKDFIASVRAAKDGETEPGYSVERKVDGLSVALDYYNGVFRAGESRGDGHFGQDVTEQCKLLEGVPMKLKAVPGGGNIRRIVVRGEVYMPEEEFLRVNAENEQTGGRIFKNPRNAASGLFTGKKLDALRNAKLRVKVFNVQYVEYLMPGNPTFPDSHTACLDILQRMGFEVVEHRFCGKQDVMWVIDHYGETRGELSYWTDGTVVKADSRALREKMGNTSSTPRWAIAFKYPPETKETRIRAITLQTGRTGRVTPVAEFDPPVYLGGTSVSRATLHNQAIINCLGVNVGDTVLVRKAQEIIPEVIRVVHKGDHDGPYDLSACVCPSCGGPLKYEDSGVVYCDNVECPAQLARYFEFVAGRDVLDIRGLGPNQIQLFIDKGWLETLPDLFRLSEHREEMKTLDGFGEKQADNILSAIDGAKGSDLHRLIKALGMDGVGNHIGKALEEKQPDIWGIAKMTEEEFREVEGVGEITARTLRAYFEDLGHLTMLHELARLGVNMSSSRYVDPEKAKEADATSLVAGKVFVITGTLSKPRAEVEAEVEAHGGKVSGSVSKKTDYLVCGDNVGKTKTDKAKALNVKVITEAELRAMF